MSERQKSVFLVATANEITRLPPEMVRKGRFDEIFFVDLPLPANRRDILTIHLRKRCLEPSQFALDALTEATQGFSGAEIEQAIVSGLFDAFSAEAELDTAIVMHSIGETVPLSKTMSEELAKLRSWAHGRARPASSRIPKEGTRGEYRSHSSLCARNVR